MVSENLLEIENENLGLCNLTSSGLSLAYLNRTSRRLGFKGVLYKSITSI